MKRTENVLYANGKIQTNNRRRVAHSRVLAGTFACRATRAPSGVEIVQLCSCALQSSTESVEVCVNATPRGELLPTVQSVENSNIWGFHFLRANDVLEGRHFDQTKIYFQRMFAMKQVQTKFELSLNLNSVELCFSLP